MSLHQYNTATKKGDIQEALTGLEQNVTNSKTVKTELNEEINNLKNVIIKRLQDENIILKDRCNKLEQKLVEFEYSNLNNMAEEII